MSQKYNPWLWLVLFFISLPAVSAADKLNSEKLNVLFIAADDLRCDLACYGHPQAITPNLDRLAARGTTFLRAYCQQALCNPSRASLMTGRRPDSLQIWDLPTHFRQVDPAIVTLPQLFKQHGYFTQGIGKLFHNWRQEIQGDPRSWSVPQVMHFATHGSDKPQVKDDALPANLATTLRAECRDVPDEAYFDGRIAARAVHALRKLKEQDQPFFLGVGFWKPHLPFNPPKRYWDLYDRSKILPAANPLPPRDVPAVALHEGHKAMASKGRKLSADEAIELREGYLAAISYLDAQVGKVLDELQRLNLAKKTIVVFWSDHGFHLGEHGLWRKTSNFELDARVPMMIALPDTKGTGTKRLGTKTKALVELLDLYPTLAELCGLDRPNRLEGVSLVPLLHDPAAKVKRAAFTQHPRPAYYKGEPQTMGVSVRTARYRYTEWRNFKTGNVEARELYDHRHDPGETRNVIANPPDQAALKEAVNLLEQTFPRKSRR